MKKNANTVSNGIRKSELRKKPLTTKGTKDTKVLFFLNIPFFLLFLLRVLRVLRGLINLAVNPGSDFLIPSETVLALFFMNDRFSFETPPQNALPAVRGRLQNNSENDQVIS